jgi:hypothetical protein
MSAAMPGGADGALQPGMSRVLLRRCRCTATYLHDCALSPPNLLTLLTSLVSSWAGQPLRLLFCRTNT